MEDAMGPGRVSQADWAARARAALPAGGFGNYDPSMFIREGRGARVWDEDGREYVDLLIGSGPMLLGHGDPEVLAATREQLDRGMTFFANNARGVELAEAIIDAIDCAEQVRFVSTGGEADMYAMRLARAFTGREKILKFEGGYHGMSAEALMSLAPQRLQNYPRAVPDSAGIPAATIDQMVIAPFNDLAAAQALIAEHAADLAAVIVEPLQRIIPPEPGFLEGLRAACDAHGIVLIFDEVVTGFRFAYGGAQELYGVTPDLCTLGKVIGGGFPLAAIAGRRDVMAHFDKAAVGPDGFLFQVGTLSGNPVAAVAGLATMEILRRPGQYARLRQIGERLMGASSAALSARGVAHQIVGDPTLFEVVFTEKPVRAYRDVLAQDQSRAKRYQQALRAEGVFKSDSKTYPSLALTEADLAKVEAAYVAAAARVVES